MDNMIVSCPSCQTLNSIDTKKLYDGSEHFFECKQCGSLLIEQAYD